MQDTSYKYPAHPEVQFTNILLPHLFNDSQFSTNPQKVAAIIDNLNVNKAPGHDHFSNKILKIIVKIPLFLSKIVDIFNACLSISYFPSDWKIGTIVVIPKPSKDPLLVSNYRPITLLSSLSKLSQN
ncbi:hypothetical protein J437_LFUL001112 [Ladona fulva]|uniref:Reverse transcriptase domain-containing protein n=1 Tax=Ladona fulva TaxID=123851 RepID=A0A8K0JWL7_LADFU|nr:hypothetical protein J437_LFUL001112 [Ladona fulva]